MVKILMKHARELLADNRVFLMVPNMSSYKDSGRTYPDETMIDVPNEIELESYSTFWSGSGRQLVTMGAFSYTGSTLHPSMSVGRYTSIAAGLKVMGNRHPLERVSTSPAFYTRALMMQTFEDDYKATSEFTPFTYRPGKISIGSDVWIGENVTFGHGVTIGDGAVVASNAVVTKDVEPYSVVGGVPAKQIKYRFPIDVVVDLKRLQWWNYSPSSISDLDMKDPRAFCDQMAKRLETGIEPFEPPKLTVSDFENAAQLVAPGAD